MTDDAAAPAPEPDAPGERMPKWVPRAVITFWLGLAALWILLGLYQRLKTLLVMIVVSLFLALAIEPAVNALVRRGWRRGLATGFAMLIVTLIGLLFVASVGALVVRQVGDLVDKSPDYLEQLERWINDTFNADVNIDDLVDELTQEGGPAREFAQRLAGSTLQLSLAALGALLQLLSVLLFTFYLVADGPRFRRTVCSVLRPDLRARGAARLGPGHRQDRRLPVLPRPAGPAVGAVPLHRLPRHRARLPRGAGPVRGRRVAVPARRGHLPRRGCSPCSSRWPSRR